MATEQEGNTAKSKFDKELESMENRFVEEIQNEITKGFEEMLRTDEWSINGSMLHANVLNHDRLKQWDKLLEEKINEAEDRDKYIENYRKRAILLIKEIAEDPKKFDELEYNPLENLITAWGRRAFKGFHMLRKSARKEATTQV